MIFDIIRSRARQGPASAALLAPGRATLDYGGLYAQLREAGTALNEGGVGQGDRVALLMSNGPEAASAFLAVSCFATAVPVNPVFGADELRGLLRDMRIGALLADLSHDPLAQALAAEFDAALFTLKVAPDSAAGCFTLIRRSVQRAVSRREPCDPGADALLLQTSGTTGRSRVVPLTHENIMAAVDRTVTMMALTPDDRGLCLAPFFHKQGLVSGLMLPLAAGGSVIYPPAFDPAAFFGWLDALAPTWYIASPAMHQAILEHAPAHPEILKGNRLRFIRSGASALPPPVLHELERVFDAPVIEAYGMSEAGIACNPLPPALRKPGTVGLPIAEVAIMGPDDEVLGVGETGEIAVRGPCVTRGYENSPLETAEQFRKGWFFTGDEGRFDADGYLEVTGRRKEIINRGGRKVAPREVEDLLRQHPDVIDAAAFPVPHPTLGEDLVAAVVLAPNTETTPQLLRNHLFHLRAAYKVPSRILVVDKIPKGTTGKLERLHLASMLDAGLRTDFVSPTSVLEAELGNIFAEVLHLETVGINDNFYALGGDSIKIVELILLLEKRLIRRVSDDIATAELTPAGLKTFLTTPRTSDTDVALDCPSETLILPFHPPGRHEKAGRFLGRFTSLFGHGTVGFPDPAGAFELFHFIGCNLKGRHPPLFWCAQNWFECNALSEAIGSDQPLYGIRSGFPPNRSERWRRMLGERYARKIAEIQPDGSIMIGGNCSGAFVAWEIAQALLLRDRQVDILFLMEATIMRPYPGRVVLLYGNDSLAYNPFLSGNDLRPEWQSLYGSYDTVELPGNHGSFFQPQTVPVLASTLRRYLADGCISW